MNWLRSTAISLSLLIHASVGYGMLPSINTDAEAIDQGRGTDIVFVEQGVRDRRAGQTRRCHGNDRDIRGRPSSAAAAVAS